MRRCVSVPPCAREMVFVFVFKKSTSLFFEVFFWSSFSRNFFSSSASDLLLVTSKLFRAILGPYLRAKLALLSCKPELGAYPLFFFSLNMSRTCSTTPGGGCKCPKTEGSPNAQLMTVFPGLGIALKLSMISRIGFRVCDADVEAVIDQVFSSSQRRCASSFEEDVRGISRASPLRSLSGRNLL